MESFYVLLVSRPADSALHTDRFLTGSRRVLLVGDVHKGYAYGQLALALLDKFQAKVWIPRVYAAVYGCVHTWTRPLEETLEPLQHAYHVGLETGDIEVRSHKRCRASLFTCRG